MAMTSLPGVTQALQALSGGATSGSVQAASGGASFTDALQGALQSTMDAQKNAANLSGQAALGQDVPMHEVIQAISKAELTLQTLVSVRDKAVEAYQEILRMPI